MGFHRAAARNCSRSCSSTASSPAGDARPDQLHDVLEPVLKISEVRAVAADTLWLSPCYRRDSIAFHFTWIQSWSDVEPVLAQVESVLAPFVPRPHWGKLSTLDGDVVRSRFERLGDFEQLADEWDPKRKFRNAYLDTLFS